jgi:hypothetical protein
MVAGTGFEETLTQVMARRTFNERVKVKKQQNVFAIYWLID